MRASAAFAALVGLGVASVQAAPLIDGVVSANEWDGALVFPPAFGNADATSTERISVKYEDGSYYFLVQPRNDFEMIAMVILINADRDSSTGLQTQVPYGSDFIMDLQLDFAGNTAGVKVVRECGKVGGPTIDPACADTNANFLVSGSDLALVTVGGLLRGVEFKIPASRFLNEGGLSVTGDFDFAFEVGVKRFNGVINGAEDFTFLRYNEPFFLDHWNSFFDLNALPTCSAPSGAVRSAVLFSDLGQKLFFQDKAFAQLFASMQYQSMQAGVPYDRVSLSDLTSLPKMCQYQVIIIPYLANTYLADLPELSRALYLLRYYYGVGIITTGNFLTNTETGAASPGHPYSHMRRILGVSDYVPVYALVTSNKINVADTSTAFSHLSSGSLLADDSVVGLFTNMYIAYSPENYDTKLVTKTIATQTFVASSPPEASSGVYNAILSSELSGLNNLGKGTGRVVHYATVESMANKDLVWPCIRWIVEGSLSTMSYSLTMSRFDHLMTMRNDCDQSMYLEEVVDLYNHYNEFFLVPMYTKFNFVGSYYVNIGEDLPNGKTTDWSVSGAYYRKWLDLENELGSHSYNHPHNINLLTDNELTHEFKDAIDVIKEKMNLDRAYSAQPGATEELRVAEYMMPIHNDGYFSGGYSGVRAGYPGVFGFLDDTSNMVYVAPNYFFDFTMIGFYKWTADESLSFWLEQIVQHTSLARQSIGHWPIHDYGPTNWGYGPTEDGAGAIGGGPGYTAEMFEKFIERAYDVGHEFATTLDLSDRIRAFTSSTLTVTPTSSRSATRVKATVSNGFSLGKLAISPLANVQGNIVGVSLANGNGWYVFSDDKVFLPSSGLEVDITFSTSGFSSDTRIIELPMRAELIKAAGNGASIDAAFIGRGIVKIAVKSGTSAADYQVTTDSTITVSTLSGMIMLNFTDYGQHSFGVA